MCRPFLLGALHGAARMGLFRLFGVCSALLFASTVTAANIIDLGPSDYRSFGPNGAHTSSGIRSSFGQTVRMPPMSSQLPVSRNPVIPYGSVANGLKNFVRATPAQLAVSGGITALFFALDWVFDQEMGEWVVMDDTYHYDDLEFNLWCLDGYGCGPTPDAACALMDLRFPDNPNTHYSGEYRIVNSTTATCRNQFGQWTPSISRTAECPAEYTYQQSTGLCVGEPEPRPLNDSDFQELAEYLPSHNPQEVSNAAGFTQRQIGNPLPGYSDTAITGPSSVTSGESTSTTTDPVTGDTIVTTTNTTTNISYGDTTITTTETTTTTTHQNGQETSTTVTTETPGELPVTTPGSGESEWPGFCEWASVVCDWLNWTQEEPPPEEDLPQPIDEDFYEEKTISFGSKACPPDHEINLGSFLSTSVSVSFQPLCDFAGLVYYMVMAASYIIAAYISIGVARNG